MADYTTINRVYSITPDLLGDAKIMDIFFDGVSPVAIRLLNKSKTFSPVSDRLPVLKSGDTGGGSFSGMDTFDRNIQDQFIYTRFEPRALEQPIALVGLERDINALAGGVTIQYEAAQTKAAAMSFVKLISQQVYADGTGNSNKDLIGLGLGVDSAGTYAGISRTTYPLWGSSEYAITTGGHSGSIANSDNGFNILRRMLYGGTDGSSNVVTRTVYGAQMPTLIVMPMNLWASFDALYSMVQTGAGQALGAIGTYAAQMARGSVNRYTMEASTQVLAGQQGNRALFFGGIPMIFDEYCPSGTIFFLNENNIEWHGVPGTEQGMVNYDLMKGPVRVDGPSTGIEASMGVSRRPNMRSFNQYGEAGDLILHGAIEVQNPKLSGKVTSVTV
jgi:hypothetical protein